MLPSIADSGVSELTIIPHKLSLCIILSITMHLYNYYYTYHTHTDVFTQAELVPVLPMEWSADFDEKTYVRFVVKINFVCKLRVKQVAHIVLPSLPFHMTCTKV